MPVFLQSLSFSFKRDFFIMWGKYND